MTTKSSQMYITHDLESIHNTEANNSLIYSEAVLENLMRTVLFKK